MHMTQRILAGLAISSLALGATVAAAQAREEAKVLIATEVLQELRSQSDQQIPSSLMQRAYGVVVVPNVTKAAFVFGGRFGSGVLSARDSQGKFSNPVFISLGGGSVGWQIGVQETDIVLVFTTPGGIENIKKGKLTLGAGASVAAGPVGRQGEAAVGTDAEVYAYSRARGLFAGVALDGTVITVSDSSNERVYGKSDVTAAEIIGGTVTTQSENIRKFVAAVTASADNTPVPVKMYKSATPGTSEPATPPPPAKTDAPAQTFPVE